MQPPVISVVDQQALADVGIRSAMDAMSVLEVDFGNAAPVLATPDLIDAAVKWTTSLGDAPALYARQLAVRHPRLTDPELLSQYATYRIIDGGAVNTLLRPALQHAEISSRAIYSITLTYVRHGKNPTATVIREMLHHERLNRGDAMQLIRHALPWGVGNVVTPERLALLQGAMLDPTWPHADLLTDQSRSAFTLALVAS